MVNTRVFHERTVLDFSTEETRQMRKDESDLRNNVLPHKLNLGSRRYDEYM